MTDPAQAAWAALGMLVVVETTDPHALPEARRITEEELLAADAAYSPVRDDTELAGVYAAFGAPAPASPCLLGAVDAALHAARGTGGLVDPAIGARLVASGGPLHLRVEAQPAWPAIECDTGAGTLRVPAGVRLDLGATGKALIADRAAARIAAGGTGALVNLGGDIATAGPPPAGGWRVRVADDHRAGPTAARPSPLTTGALATSSTTVGAASRRPGASHRRHRPGDRGRGAPSRVAAATCVDANTASTAAIVLGDDAHPSGWPPPALPARLVAARRRGDARRPAGRRPPSHDAPCSPPAPRALVPHARDRRGHAAAAHRERRARASSSSSAGRPAGRAPRFVDRRAASLGLAARRRAASAMHVLTAVLDTFAPIRLLDAVVPFTGVYRPLWLGLGALAFDLPARADGHEPACAAASGCAPGAPCTGSPTRAGRSPCVHGLGHRLRHEGRLDAGAHARLRALRRGRRHRARGCCAATPARTRGARGPALAAVAVAVAALRSGCRPGRSRRGWARRVGHAGGAARRGRSRARRRPRARPRSAAGRRGRRRLQGRRPRRAAPGQPAPTGTAVVDLRCAQRSPGALRVRMAGSPLDGGGLMMQAARSRSAPPGDPARYRGRVDGLDGTSVARRRRRADGRALRLRARLCADRTRRAPVPPGDARPEAARMSRAADPARCRAVLAGVARLRRPDLAEHGSVHGRRPRAPDLIAAPAARRPARARRRRSSRPRSSCARSPRGRGRRVVVVNGAEGEPMSAKDRVLLERAPHLVLDGALAAAERGRRARRSWSAVPRSRSAPAPRSRAALAERDDPRRVRLGGACPTRYLAGEETALLRGARRAARRSRRSRRRGRPSAASRRRPTLVQNAETLAHLALIARHGPRLVPRARHGRRTPVRRSSPSAAPSRAPGRLRDRARHAAARRCVEAGGRHDEQPRAILVGGYHGAWLDAGRAGALALDDDALARARARLGAGRRRRAAAVGVPGRRGLARDDLAGRPRPRASAGRACTAWPRSPARSPRSRGAAPTPTRCAALRRWAGRSTAAAPATTPTASARFLRSALDVFAAEFELTTAATAPCERCTEPAVLAIPRRAGGRGMSRELRVDPIACTGHGACAELLPEMITLDDWGYPILAPGRCRPRCWPTPAAPRARARRSRSSSLRRRARPGAGAARSAAAPTEPARAVPCARWRACARGAARCPSRSLRDTPRSKMSPAVAGDARALVLDGHHARARRRRTSTPTPTRCRGAARSPAARRASARRRRRRLRARRRRARASASADGRARGRRAASARRARRTTASRSRSVTCSSPRVARVLQQVRDRRVEPIGLGQRQLGLRLGARRGRPARRPPRGAAAAR